MASSAQHSRIATSLGLLSIVFWSTTVAVARSITEQLGPITAAAVVYSWGGCVSLLYLVFSKALKAKLSGLNNLYLFGCGAFFVLYMLCLYLSLGFAVDRQQTLEVGLVNYLWPSLILVFSVPVLGKKANWLLIVGLLCASAGVYLTLTHKNSASRSVFINNFYSNPEAYLLALTAAISWALYSTFSRRWAPAGPSAAVSLFMLATGVTLIFLRILFYESSNWNMQTVLEILYLGTAVTLGYVFWDIAMRKGDVVFVASCSYLTPLLSTLIACTYLQVIPGVKLWYGCGLIIGGAFICKRSLRDL